MTKMFKKAISLLFILTILAVVLSVNSFAIDAAQRIESFNSFNSEIILIAHRGDWHSFPENSVQAVQAARDYGIISVDVKLTSDGKAVLMADTTTDRMCVDEKGNTVTGSISSFSLTELAAMYLRAANGTVKNEKTDFHPASLEDAASVIDNDSVLMLNLTCADFNAIYGEVQRLGITDRVIFRFSDSNKKIIETVSAVENINVCGNYQGNIIFLATSAVADCRKNGINTVELGSKNGHGVLYDNFLMKRFDSESRAMVSMVNGRCGKRTDNETGWDDLISRGYSVIETDYPAELSSYIKKIGTAKDELQRYVNLYADTDTAPFTVDTENAFKSALSEAERLISQPSSLSEIDNARYNLESSYDNLTVGPKKAVTLSFDITFGRVLAVVLCGGAILASQIFLYKRRVKK